MSIKQGLQDNNKKLAQTKFDIQQSTNSDGNTVLEISGIGSTGLGAGVLQGQGLDALLSQTQEVDTFDDHICQGKKHIADKEKTCEQSSGFGHSCSKKTLCLNGDITYSKKECAEENGQAQQVVDECEEEDSFTVTQLAALPPPLACVPVSLCPGGTTVTGTPPTC